MNPKKPRPQKQSPPRTVSAGGSATVNGVLYQMLWTLLRASRATFAKPPLLENNLLQEVTLVLEPIGGGGDLVAQSVGQRSVEQLKARPDGSTWSLKEVVEKVIPDLYLAGINSAVPTSYRFVTEGRIGRWKKDYAFFRSIIASPCPDDPLSDIDNITPLKSAKVKKKDAKIPAAAAPVSFWERDSYTARDLFLQIVSAVRERKFVSGNETETQTQKSLRSVLANFEFVGGQYMMAVQKEIDSHLLAIVAKNDDVPRIRDSLAMELARLATKGGAEIKCKEFFEAHGLNAIPLNEWATLRRQSQKIAEFTLQCLGYEPGLDVRTDRARQAITAWPTDVPILAITGESGSGKSWSAYGIGTLAQAHESLCAIISAAATADETLNRASATVWQEIAGHDEAISLSRIADRIRIVIGGKLNPWLTLIVDGITDRQQAVELIRQPWECWGIRLVVTVSKPESTALEQQSKNRCRVVTVGRFNHRELHDYLGLFLGENWPAMPGFMRDLLQVPLLADIYRQIVVASGNRDWIPHSEYELIELFWGRLRQQPAMDEDVLIRLAEKYLADGIYPWSIRTVSAVGAQNDAVQRLEMSGWVRTNRSIADTTVELTHSRLLNWVCAIALLRQLRSGAIDQAAICAAVKSFFDGTSQQHSHRLSFVPMDLLWLMCQNDGSRGQIPAIIAALEGQYRQSEVLYVNLLPTVGPQIVDGLVARLRDSIDEWFVPSLIARSLATIGGDAVTAAGLSLLQDNNPFLRLEACSLFAECPSPQALDLLWQLHNDCAAIPEKYLRERERQNTHILYSKTFASMRACCCALPDWLSGAIANADPAKESVADLAYLVASVELEQGRILWSTVKDILIGKTPVDKLRAIATCIRRFVDRDEIPWLLEHLEKDHLIGVAAASALVRIDPASLLRALHRIHRREAVLARNWFLDQLIAIHPDETRQRIRDLMQQDGDVWKAAAFYQGRFDFLDIETLQILLWDLQKRLPTVLSEPDWGDREPLLQELSFLSQINTKSLVDHIRKLPGTEVETLLTQFVLRIGPRTSPSRDSFVHEKAIDFLYRINGTGFTSVANDMLRAESRFARLEAITLVGKKPDDESFELLSAIVQQQETWDGHYLEQCRAAVVLALNGVWDPVVRLVQNIGLQVLQELSDLPRRGLRPPLTLITSIANALPQDLSHATAGDVLALGFGGPELARVVRAITEACPPDSDVAHACVIALELLPDHDEQSVTFLCNQLQVKSHSFSATNALIMNGTRQALESLANGAVGGFSGAIAVNMIERSADRMTAITKTRETIIHSIQNDHCGDYVCSLWQLVRSLRDDAAVGEILAHSAIEEFLYKSAFEDERHYWRVGKKACAIRCLAYIDRNEAFLAARAVLRAPDAHDRECYPQILVDLNPIEAVAVLLDQLITEWAETENDTKSLQKSIGRAFCRLKADDQLLDYVCSLSPEARRAACFAAGWSTIKDEVRDQLVASLSDADEEVAREAAAAIARIAVCEECQVLGQAVMTVTDETDRWLYLECLLALADPGDADRFWPVEGPEIGNVLTQAQRDYTLACLKKRREKEKLNHSL